MTELTVEQQATLDRWEATLQGKNGPLIDGTFLPNPQSAHHFYQVMEGMVLQQSCSAGMVFNPDAIPEPMCYLPQQVSRDVNPAPRNKE